jgi:hypothetical protein
MAKKTFFRCFIVRLRMWYAKVQGRKRWNYDPSKNYMRGK